MAYKEYPWSRFNRWLNQQPDNAIAGNFTDYDNVLADFLFLHSNRMFCLPFCYPAKFRFLGGKKNYPCPKWCGLLIKQITLLSKGKSYQYRTVKKALKIVSKEIRGQAHGD